ncbi:MAG: SGNH/GDSL hydrolase family protein [Acidobacteria bacterium]|nr:SGNH/GDSL hydrolase family protein [Acidobacteriota bacterium]
MTRFLITALHSAGRSRNKLSVSQCLCGGILILLFGTLLGRGVVQGQTPDPSKTIAELERELAAQVRLLSDWGGLTRYGSENAELGPPAPGVDRVVFLGDEITEMWGRGKVKFFPGKPFLNRGISHQTTPQMLVRFRQDVISLKPKAVLIQAGSSDLAGYAGPATEGTIAENFMSMTELAKANGIRVVLASVTPVCDCFRTLTDRRPPGKIIGINGWLKDYAARSGSIYLDYYSALAEGRAMKKELTVDGLTPNDAGYQVMAPLAEQAIAQALDRK